MPALQVAPALLESVSPAAYRAAMRRVPTAVTIVTADADGVRHGCTATAVTSVSAEPPQLLVCLDATTRSATAIRSAGRFGLNVLRNDHTDLAKAFAAPVADAECRFRRADWRATAGAPLLADALIGFDCHLVDELESATHVVLIGRVAEVHHEEGEPLVYRDGVFGGFSAEVVARPKLSTGSSISG